ncbi:hypothetical protein [Streptomyces sp.]|uniref:hypothetical protein n=1 Tax=Streptomyces sp. TaxID=1931 RepID=UPI002F40850B
MSRAARASRPSAVLRSSALRVHPPGSTFSLVVPQQITVCGTTFTVTPFAAGSTGNPST